MEEKYTYGYDAQANAVCIYENGEFKGYFTDSYADKLFKRLLTTDGNLTLTNMVSNNYRNHLIRTFHACLAKSGIMEHKESILSGYGVESTTELTNEQLQELIDRYSVNREKTSTADVEVRRLRSDILVILNKMGIYATNNDWTAVNDFCLKHTKKMLFQMSVEELKKARRQFNAIADYVIKKKQENEVLAKNN
ncbi:MAG: hypothetical protein ACOXZ9_03380 [Bacteroidales bacterium]